MPAPKDRSVAPAAGCLKLPPHGPCRAIVSAFSRRNCWNNLPEKRANEQKLFAGVITDVKEGMCVLIADSLSNRPGSYFLVVLVGLRVRPLPLRCCSSRLAGTYYSHFTPSPLLRPPSHTKGRPHRGHCRGIKKTTPCPGIARLCGMPQHTAEALHCACTPH